MDASPVEILAYLQTLKPLRNSPYPEGTTCVVLGCCEADIKGMAHGSGPYCTYHHGRALRGEVLAPREERREERPEVCSFEGCGRPFHNRSGKGLLPEGVPLCKTHYDGNLAGKSLAPIKVYEPLPDSPDWIPISNREVRARNAALPEGMKFCNGCGEGKPLTSFYFKVINGVRKPAARCIDCARLRSSERNSTPEGAAANRERTRTWAEENPRRVQERNLKKFNLPLAVYDQMLEAQGGVCRLCKRPPGQRSLAVDHDHDCCPGNGSCGRCIRGLVCDRCNPHIFDDPAMIGCELEYVLEHKIASGHEFDFEAVELSLKRISEMLERRRKAS